jgi:enoyl-CoA hydratase/carnithine racemase
LSRYETLAVTEADGVVEVTLNRPEQLNALNAAARAELTGVASAMRDDPARRVLLITGAGRAFSAGADLKDGSVEEAPIDSVESRWFGDFRATLASIGKPSIAAVNGVALGGGCELALACDFRLASPQAAFALPEINLGSMPAGGGTQRLARLVGLAQALEIVLFGERIDAAEAYRIGLVNRLLPADDLLPTARAWAKKLAAKAPLAVKYAREAVLKSTDISLDDGIRLEAYLGGLLRTTEDRIEGLAAFRDKRPPVYRGR